MIAIESPRQRDEGVIRRLVDEQLFALRTKDLDRLMTLYADDFVLYDVNPPFRLEGAAAIRRLRDAWAAQVPDFLGIELRDVHVTASGDLGIAHWTWRFVGSEPQPEDAGAWYRGTAAYRRIREQWKIIHLHESLPHAADGPPGCVN